jgi:type I restriction enzyme S subunit
MAELLGGRPSYRWRTDASGGTHASRQVPDGWTYACLNDTGLFINGLAFKPTDWGTAGRPIIRIQNLSGQNPTFNLTHRVVSPDNIVKDGDLLVSWSATLDTFVWRGPEGVLNQHIFKVIPNREAVTTGFLYWLLKHEVRQLAQSQHAHGLAMMHINRGPFLAHGVLLPPLEEQHRIVAKVDELMALCDELEAAHTQREAWRDRLRATSLRSIVAPDEPKENARFFLRHSARMITCSEHVAGVRQTIWDLAVQGRLVQQDSTDEPASDWLRRSAEQAPGEVASRSPINGLTPPGWATITLNDLAPTVTSGSRGWAQFYADRGALFVRSQNIKYGSLLMNDRAYVAPPARSEGTRTSIDVGDLLVVITGDVGHVAIWDQNLGEAYVSQHVALVKPFTPKVSRWLLLCLMAPTAGRGQLRSSIYGGKPGLNLDQVRSVVVPLPPIAEQRRIVAKVDELMAVCDGLEESLAEEQTERGRLLEALLHDALEDALPARELEPLGAR